MPHTILVAEDDDLNRKLFGDLLALNGYHTLQAATGLDALRLARAHRPNLVLLNILLPDISGLDVARHLKGDADLRHIPILAVTGLAMPGDKQRILATGCNGYILKPIKVTSYLRTIERTLRAAPRAP